MKLDDLAAKAPVFIKQVVDLVGGPKRFITSLDLASPGALRSALVFYALAVAVSLVLELPFAAKSAGLEERLPLAAVVLVLGLMLSNVILTLVFRLLGGSGGYLLYLIVTLYNWGVGVLIWAVGALMSKGLMMVQAPQMLDNYLEYMGLLLARSETINDPKFKPLVESDAMVNAVMLFAVAQLLLLVWFGFSWRSYRVINQLNTTRSAWALGL